MRIVCGAGSIKRSGVRPSVCPSVSLSHQSNAVAACGGFAVERRTRKRYRSTAPVARQQQRRSTALSSKCGDQCHVDSRVDETKHRRVSFYFRPIKMLAVFTACVSGWQHAWNYISTRWVDWTWMDRRTKISRISSWKIWQP